MGCGCHDHGDEHDPFAEGAGFDEYGYHAEGAATGFAAAAAVERTWEDIGMTFQAEFSDLFFASAGWLVVGMVIAALAQPVVAPIVNWSRRAAGRGTLGQAVAGTLAGLAIPCCSCGILPIAAGVARQGAPVAAAAMAFVSSGAGLDSLVYTVGAWGAPTAAARVGAVAFVGLVSSLFAAAFRSEPAATDTATAPDGKKADNGAPACCADAASSVERGPIGYLKSTVVSCIAAFEDVFPSIVLGMALTAAHTAYVGGDAAAGAGAATSAATRLQVLAAATPLQMCEYGVVHLCKGLLAGGMSVGTVLAFLIIGPSTSMAWVGLIARYLGAAAACAGIAAALATALAASYATDALLPPDVLPTLHKQGLGPVMALPAGIDDVAPLALAALGVGAVLRRVLGGAGNAARTAP